MIETTRERRIDELFDSQISLLFEADIYREHGDEQDRQEVSDMQQRAQSMAGGGNPGRAQAIASDPRVPQTP